MCVRERDWEKGRETGREKEKKEVLFGVGGHAEATKVLAKPGS